MSNFYSANFGSWRSYWRNSVISGAVYYTLGNIQPEDRSQLYAIQLVALVTVPLVKKYGIDAILEPFMNDLKELEKVTFF